MQLPSSTRAMMSSACFSARSARGRSAARKLATPNPQCACDVVHGSPPSAVMASTSSYSTFSLLGGCEAWLLVTTGGRLGHIGAWSSASWWAASRENEATDR